MFETTIRVKIELHLSLFRSQNLQPAVTIHIQYKCKIITPHLGEFHKIFPKIKRNLNNIDKAVSAVKLTKSNIVLKGPNTIIISYNKKIVINDHASSELAVIGSGDVLSGLIVSLIGEKKMNPFLAGCAATWLHGDIAKYYEKGLIAEDLVQGIPSALKRLKKSLIR